MADDATANVEAAIEAGGGSLAAADPVFRLITKLEVLRKVLSTQPDQVQIATKAAAFAVKEVTALVQSLPEARKARDIKLFARIIETMKDSTTDLVLACKAFTKKSDSHSLFIEAEEKIDAMVNAALELKDALREPTEIRRPTDVDINELRDRIQEVSVLTEQIDAIQDAIHPDRDPEQKEMWLKMNSEINDHIEALVGCTKAWTADRESSEKEHALIDAVYDVVRITKNCLTKALRDQVQTELRNAANSAAYCVALATSNSRAGILKATSEVCLAVRVAAKSATEDVVGVDDAVASVAATVLTLREAYGADPEEDVPGAVEPVCVSAEACVEDVRATVAAPEDTQADRRLNAQIRTLAAAAQLVTSLVSGLKDQAKLKDTASNLVSEEEERVAATRQLRHEEAQRRREERIMDMDYSHNSIAIQVATDHLDASLDQAAAAALAAPVLDLPSDTDAPASTSVSPREGLSSAVRINKSMTPKAGTQELEFPTDEPGEEFSVGGITVPSGLVQDGPDMLAEYARAYLVHRHNYTENVAARRDLADEIGTLVALCQFHAAEIVDHDRAAKAGELLSAVVEVKAALKELPPDNSLAAEVVLRHGPSVAFWADNAIHRLTEGSIELAKAKSQIAAEDSGLARHELTAATQSLIAFLSDLPEKAEWDVTLMELRLLNAFVRELAAFATDLHTAVLENIALAAVCCAELLSASLYSPQQTGDAVADLTIYVASLCESANALRTASAEELESETGVPEELRLAARSISYSVDDLVRSCARKLQTGDVGHLAIVADGVVATFCDALGLIRPSTPDRMTRLTTVTRDVHHGMTRLLTAVQSQHGPAVAAVATTLNRAADQLHATIAEIGGPGVAVAADVVDLAAATATTATGLGANIADAEARQSFLNNMQALSSGVEAVLGSTTVVAAEADIRDQAAKATEAAEGKGAALRSFYEAVAALAAASADCARQPGTTTQLGALIEQATNAGKVFAGVVDDKRSQSEVIRALSDVSTMAGTYGASARNVSSATERYATRAFHRETDEYLSALRALLRVLKRL